MNRTSSKESKLPKIGGAVHASSIGKKVTVLTVDSSKEEIVVQAGNMKLKQIMCYALSFSEPSVWRKKQAFVIRVWTKKGFLFSLKRITLLTRNLVLNSRKNKR
ncbi:hypothetical protein K1719_038629 [Acacia pycnantha]|nr:hypothetical protein K1719_038629 [Acacia pycnantha]